MFHFTNAVKLTKLTLSAPVLFSLPAHGLQKLPCWVTFSPVKPQVNPLSEVKVSIAACNGQSCVKSSKDVPLKAGTPYLSAPRLHVPNCALTRSQVFPCATVWRCEVTLQQTPTIWPGCLLIFNLDYQQFLLKDWFEAYVRNSTYYCIFC